MGNVIPVAIRRWRKNLWETIKSGEWRRFKQRLRAEKYDLVIDAQGLLKSAWLTRYVKAPVAGFDRDSAREPLASRFYQRRLAVARGQHAVERLRQLFAVALGYDLPKGLGDYGLDVDRLVELPRQKPFVLFLHGTTWDTKHWPEVYWRDLAIRMGHLGVQVRLPWGNPAEKARAERTLGRDAAGTGLRVVSYRPGGVLREGERARWYTAPFWVFRPLKRAIEPTAIGEAMLEVTARGSDVPGGILENRDLLRFANGYRARHAR